MKRMVILILALVLALTFAACGEIWGKKESTDETSSVHSVEKTGGEQSGTAAADSSVPVESLPGESSGAESTEEPSTNESSDESPGKESTEEPSTNESSDESSGAESTEEPRLFQLELTASLKVGELIEYIDSPYGGGPQAYSINEDGEVFILSAITKEIICATDKTILETPDIYMIHDCVSFGRDVYVLTYENKIYKYNMTAGLTGTYDLPENITPKEINKMTCSSGSLVFDTSNGRAFILKDGAFVETASPITHKKTGDVLIVTVNGKTFSINMTAKSADIVGYDDEGVYAYEFVEIGSDISEYKFYIKKYGYSGKVLGCAEIDQSDSVTFLLKDCVYAFGNLYFIKCRQETIDVYKVTLGNADISRLPAAAS